METTRGCTAVSAQSRSSSSKSSGKSLKKSLSTSSVGASCECRRPKEVGSSTSIESKSCAAKGVASLCEATLVGTSGGGPLGSTIVLAVQKLAMSRCA
eukprot:scaffold115873_cov26-Tisochrysis_lutea.AAC.2